MQKGWKRFLEILDGAPAVTGERRSGQAMVELALITPILIILFAGLVEIGWFANNYLNLLDVTRAGARRATTFSGALSPTSWNNVNSLVPNTDLPANSQTTNTAETGDEIQRREYRPFQADGTCINPIGSNVFQDDIQPQGFYNAVVCLMLRSMPPIEIRDNGIDDIVVSGFAIANVDPRGDDSTFTTTWMDPILANRPLAANVPQMIVVGRYPSNANECNVRYDLAGTTVELGAREGRDPFDFNNNTLIDFRSSGTSDPRNTNAAFVQSDFDEVIINGRPGYDAPVASVLLAEKQVGFSWFGHRTITNTPCIGSMWTMDDIEDVMNLPNYDMPLLTDPDQSRREAMPNQGLVLVEMWWEHELLLKIPILSPVFTLLGDRTVINVWAAFPLPQVEPFITFE